LLDSGRARPARRSYEDVVRDVEADRLPVHGAEGHETAPLHEKAVARRDDAAGEIGADEVLRVAQDEAVEPDVASAAQVEENRTAAAVEDDGPVRRPLEHDRMLGRARAPDDERGLGV